MATNEPNFYLFGGYKSWNENAWCSSDDRVRGGKSKSYLECPPDSNIATFHGTLDIKVLKGAGFASQHTVDPQNWDLVDYQGLRVGVGAVDGMRYTLVLKDEVPVKRTPDVYDESTVSWEFEFVPSTDEEVSVRWKDFRPTYRGVPVQDTEPLRLDRIKRIGILMRSFFGAQEGPFKLELKYIAAIESEDKSSDIKPKS
ncbi:NADH:ubiquinone oxidoreductase complex I intermediate-associated protein 30 [Annulohypoxylon moriforme]|nr:NADH:ubiquinone oxidoreductase complex I intermediate-associated protein 30 [Annulohypoxylon moriforme]